MPRRRPPPAINEEEERPHAGLRRKKTRRWCRGKVGIDHRWAWRDWLDFGTVCRCHKGCPDHRIVYVMEVCMSCGRHGDLKTERRPNAK